MYQLVILYTASVLGVICLFLIYGKKKKHHQSLVNKFLSIIVAIQVVKFMIYTTSVAYPTLAIVGLRNIYDLFLAALLPCFFLYFDNLVFENKYNTNKLKHFIAPGVFITIFLLRHIVSPENDIYFRKVFFLFLILFYIIYSYLAFRMLNKYVWHRKSEIKSIQRKNRLIKNWTIFLYFSFILSSVIRLLLKLVSKDFINSNDQLVWVNALIWISIFIKILLTPEILYGYNFLKSNIDSLVEKVVPKSVWKLDGTIKPLTNENDKRVEQKLSLKLTDHILKIEELSFHSNFFRNNELDLEDIATEMKIPVSHINFIFKYHCLESFPDYKKIVRIHDACKMLKNGYLNEKTVQALSEAVGFSSYITFYHAFKSITGVTTQEYMNRL